MKLLFAFLFGIAAMIGIYCLDGSFINYIVSLIPASAIAWIGLVKVVLWILAVCWTTGLAILAGVIGFSIIALITKLD